MMRAKTGQRSGVALLVTLFFIIALTTALGISLSQLQKGSAEVYKGDRIVQSSALLEDLLLLLKSSPELKMVKDAESLNVMLQSASVIPFEAEGLEVLIRMNSEMGKLNINSLIASIPKGGTFYDSVLIQRFNEYLQKREVQDPSYLSQILVDCMGGIKIYYNSDIFDYEPQLYRDRIASREHLSKILDFYARMRHDGSVYHVAWDELVRFDDNLSTGLDANYVSAELWQMILPDISEEQALDLASGERVYTTLEDLSLGEEEVAALGVFHVNTYEPKIRVSVEMLEHNRSSRMAFDYDLNSTTAKEFSYAI